MTVRVVLVRRWVDAHGGGGCCSGDLRGGICLDHRVGGEREDRAAEQASDRLASVYRLLREHAPEVDVQVVGADNIAYLLPASFLAARKRMGRLAALRHAVRSTTAGAVLVDGVVVGDAERLGPQGVLEAVLEAGRQAGSGTSSTAATV